MDKELAWAEISLSALKNNCEVINERTAPGTRLAVVVKGDAYGHGAIPVLKEAEKWGTVSMAVTGTLQEAREIRDAGISLPVLLLNRIPAYAIEETLLDRFVFSAYEKKFLYDINEAGSQAEKTISVHLRIDLNHGGMGILPEKFPEIWKECKSLPHVRITGIYTHPYSIYGDEEQFKEDIQVFDRMLRILTPRERAALTVHGANSKGIFRYPGIHYDMVRAGVAFYGLPYEEETDGRLRQAISIWGRVVSIESLKKKSRTCYTELCNEEVEKIAHIPLGYWDAPFLLAEGKTMCQIRGKRYPVFGEPCMETCCVDITGDQEIQVGDPVCFLGQGDMDVSSVMKRLGIDASHCERLCMTSSRLRKIYT